MKKTVLFLLAMVVLGGCAEKGGWIKADHSSWDESSLAQFRQDSYECQKDMQIYATRYRENDVYSVLANEQNRTNWFNNCMWSKGYMWQKDTR